MPHTLPQHSPATANPATPFTLALRQSGEVGYSATAATIRETYWRSHRAALPAPMPLLLSLSAGDGATCAALGLRSAGTGGLFLESYLEPPIESAIASAAGMPVLRERIIEIGNLAASRRIGSQQLFIIMTAVITAAGFQWMTFTATPQVVKLIGRLGFVPLDLGRADPTKLANRGAGWGSYFDTAPRLQAGLLSEAMAVLNANSQSAALLTQHCSAIQSLARQLDSAVRQHG